MRMRGGGQREGLVLICYGGPAALTNRLGWGKKGSPSIFICHWSPPATSTHMPGVCACGEGGSSQDVATAETAGITRNCHFCALMGERSKLTLEIWDPLTPGGDRTGYKKKAL